MATQENFRLMREALDEVGEELGRYIRLCNYCSGLCMPEIAVMGALNDWMSCSMMPYTAFFSRYQYGSVH